MHFNMHYSKIKFHAFINAFFKKEQNQKTKRIHKHSYMHSKTQIFRHSNMCSETQSFIRYSEKIKSSKCCAFIL